VETHRRGQTGAYGQRGAAKNSGEKPGKVAEKHPGAGCEAMIERKDPNVKKRRKTELVEIPKFAGIVAEWSSLATFC